MKRDMKRVVPLQERIILALDLPSREPLTELLSLLSPLCGFYKVGLELFLAAGWAATEDIKRLGHKVMLDLKFHDIPQTTERAMRQLRGRGIDYATVHADAAAGALAGRQEDTPKILAVTLLTSVQQNEDAERVVLRRAESALRLGCDGLVASACEAALLRKEFGEEFILVTPGIRNRSGNDGNAGNDDQQRTATARQAIKAGADHLVIGRPVMLAKDPRQVLYDIQKSIAKK